MKLLVISLTAISFLFLVMGTRNKTIGAILSSLIVLTVAVIRVHAAPPSYIIEDIGNLGGDQAMALGINDSGQAVGFSFTSANPTCCAQGFRVPPGTTTPDVNFSTLAGGPITYAFAVNSSRHVAGSRDFSGGGGIYHAFRYDGSNLIELDQSSPVGHLGSHGLAINDSEEVVGALIVNPTTAHAARFMTAGSPEDLGTLGGNYSAALGVNDSGEIVGYAETRRTPPGDYWNPGHAFLWQPTDVPMGMADLNGLVDNRCRPRSSECWELHKATAINDGSRIVGFARIGNVIQAFLFLPRFKLPRPGERVIVGGQVKGLGTFLNGGISYALGLNDKEQVVGAAYLDASGRGNYRAALFTGGRVWNLNALIGQPDSCLVEEPAASCWVLREATSINNAGQIVGWGAKDGKIHAFRLTPRSAVAASAAALRLDKVLYAVQDCVQVTLSAPALAGTTELAQPTVDLGTTNGRFGSGQLVTVPLFERPAGSGVFSNRGCIRLQPSTVKPRSGVLNVAPGDAIAALARIIDGTPLAIGLATVAGGQGSGRFHAVIDRSILSPAIFSQEPTAPIAAAVDPTGTRTGFMQNQVIFRERAPGDLSAFLTRWKGRLLNSLTLPGSGTRGTPEAAPVTFSLVEVDLSRVDSSDFELLAERFSNTTGTWRYSSADAVRLFSLIVQELAAGSIIFPNAVLQPLAFPVSDEGAQIMSTGGDYFKQPWFNPQDMGQVSRLAVRGGEGLAFAQILKPTVPVPVAFLDSGFGGPSDYNPPGFNSPDYGPGGFNAIPQCSIDGNGNATCGAGTAAGMNQGKCSGGGNCPWHGMEMFSSAAAWLDNGYGAAGIGSRVVAPSFYKLETQNTFTVAVATKLAVQPPTGNPAKIINMSFGASCKVLILDICSPFVQALVTDVFCDVILAALVPASQLTCAELAVLVGVVANLSSLQAAINTAENAGAVVVAAAGNNKEEVDDDIVVPCTLAKVVCVGALDVDPGKFAPKARDSSGAGQSVRVWAPGTAITTMPEPSNQNAGVNSINGTSPATAIVSGSLALVRSINPVLSPQGVRDVLAAANCPGTFGFARIGGGTCTKSNDAKVNQAGYLDFLELLRRARDGAGKLHLTPCTGGWDSDEGPSSNDDTPATAIALSSVPAVTGAFVEYAGSGDLSIHGLTGTISPEVDWYKLTFQPTPLPLGFNVQVIVPVPDPVLGILRVDLFRTDPTNPPGPPIPVPPTFIQPSSSGIAEVRAVARTDATYYARVATVSGHKDDTNCYTKVRFEVKDPAPLPCVPGLPICQ